MTNQKLVNIGLITIIKHILKVLIIISSITYSQELNSSNENQPKADLMNGFYKNPILQGDYGDPSIVKVDNWFYLAFSRGNGFLIFKSQDLVNWQAVIRHSFDNLSKIWAIDIQYFNNQFHIYMPVFNWSGKTNEHYAANFVVTSKNIDSCWSDPIRVDTGYISDLYYTGIDPGFIQDKNGKKFLYNDHGYVTELDDEGLHAISQPKIVYEGWKYPSDWVVQCECLESPKLFKKGKYFYLVSAMGGTNGPSTAHMAVIARSKSPIGPWENSPFNPLIKTMSIDEPFWQQGHATIFEGNNQQWFTVFHGRLKDYPELGRSTLLMPIEWSKDGWPVIKKNSATWSIIRKPDGKISSNEFKLSDDFSSDAISIQWNSITKYKDIISLENEQLKFKLNGISEDENAFISLNVPNKNFEVSVKIKCSGDVAGALLFGNDEGLRFNGEKVEYNLGADWRKRNTDYLPKRNQVYLKLRNYKKDLSFFCSVDGIKWIPFSNGVHSGQYIIKLAAWGSGKVYFDDFKYLGIK